MSARTVAMLVALAVAPVAKGEVLVELVPDNPGPYVGGEALTVDVWLHSEVAFDAFLFAVQLDFSDSDPALSLDATFTFDLSAIPTPRGDYHTVPQLPVPTVGVVHDGPISPENMLPLPAGGSLHIGSIGVQLPADSGAYRLDTLNSDDPSEERGATIQAQDSVSPSGITWRAFTGEVTGGNFAFIVGDPPIPTVSEWGLILMTLLLLVVGSVTIMRRSRSTARSALVTALLTLSLLQSSAVAQNAGGGVALNLRQANGRFELSLDNGPPFHATPRDVHNERMIDLNNLHDRRDNLLIVDETDLLQEMQTVDYTICVPASEPALRATLVFTDPMGNCAATLAKINDLSLKVTSPSADVYWGNNGLLTGNWSVADADPLKTDAINTVENVFVENPEAGQWTITVSADEIVVDGHVETDPAVDVDFALVVSGLTNKSACCTQPFGICKMLNQPQCDFIGGVFKFCEACPTVCEATQGPQQGP